MKQEKWLNIISILFIIFILLPLIFNLFGYKNIEGAIGSGGQNENSVQLTKNIGLNNSTQLPLYKTLNDISNNAISVSPSNFPYDKIFIPINMNIINTIIIHEWWPNDIPFVVKQFKDMSPPIGAQYYDNDVSIVFYMDIYGNSYNLIPPRVINNALNPNILTNQQELIGINPTNNEFNMDFPEMYNNIDSKLTQILKKIN